MPVSIQELMPLPTQDNGVDLLAVPQGEWDRSVGLARAFAPFAETYALPKRQAKAIAQQFDMSLRHVRRLRAKFQATAQTSSLVRQKGGRPKGYLLLNEQVEQIIAHVINRYYAQRESESKASIVERVRLITKRLGLPPPCRKAVLSRIRMQDTFALDAKRRGNQAARQRWEPRPGKLLIERPLDLMQIDHTLADVLLVSDDGAQVIGRPWLTLAIDVATRSVAGYHLTMDAPSSISVAMCIAHALLPKPESRDDPDFWPMYGKWRRILVDNGKDLRSIALIRGCDQHGIDLTWRPIRKPYYGAHIERLMGTFMRIVHTLPGTTFSNPRQRGDYPSESKACMTLDDFRTWLVEKICRSYHVRHHRGIGRAPLLAWEQGIEQVNGARSLPAVPLDVAKLRCDFYPFVIRRLQRTGVQCHGSRYWNSALAALIRPEVTVKVHYDPRDRSRVWVRDSGDHLIEAQVIAGHAVSEGKAARITPEIQARIDRMMAAGYDVSDDVIDHARQRRRANRKTNTYVVPGQGQGKRGGRKTLAVTPDIDEAEPPISLTHNPIRVEVFEP